MNRRSNYIDFNDVKGLEMIFGNMRERITCFICQGLICDPVQCPEEHAYCSRCIETWGGSCPQCRRGNFKKARTICDLLSNVTVYCYYCQKDLKYEKYIECNHSPDDLYKKIQSFVKQKKDDIPSKDKIDHYHIVEKSNNTDKEFMCGLCDKKQQHQREKYKCTTCNYAVCVSCFEN